MVKYTSPDCSYYASYEQWTLKQEVCSDICAQFPKKKLAFASISELNQRNGRETFSSTETSSSSKSGELDAQKSLIILISIFITSLVAMFYVYMMFPELDE